MIFDLPVQARDRRTAETSASVPELANRISSMLGKSCLIFSATRIVISVGKAQLAAPIRDLVGDGANDLLGAMAQNQRAVGHVEIDVFVAVDVPHARALSASGDERQVIGEHAHRAAVPAGDRLFPPLEDLLAEGVEKLTVPFMVCIEVSFLRMPRRGPSTGVSTIIGRPGSRVA